MLILGHLGCTLAATQAGEVVYKKFSGRRFRSATALIDYRMLALGSMLPDIIDKPLAWLGSAESFDGVTRSIGHTLVFSLLIFALWFVVSRNRRNFLLPFAIGSSLHLLFDAMFTMPNTLFWPINGWEFTIMGRSEDLFSGLPLPWDISWSFGWLPFSEVLGGLFIGQTLYLVWRKQDINPVILRYQKQ